MNRSGIWIYAEQTEGHLPRVVNELMAAAQQVGSSLAQPVTAVLIGNGVEGLAGNLFELGADRVLLVERPELAVYRNESYASVIAGLVGAEQPALLFFPSTSSGKSLAARVAARLGAGLVADVIDIRVEGGNLLYTHATLGGKGRASCQVSTGLQMATLRAKAWPEGERIPGRTGDLVKPDLPGVELDPATEVKEFVRKVGERVTLEEADIIVSGGRGTGGDFSLIQELADVVGGAVGASRAAVDSGWIPYEHQVGQTGKTVSPKIYIACGISGAIQHLAGMQSSGTIIAVNKNPDAPIFQVATFGIVGDLFQVLPHLIDEFQKEL